MKLMNFLVKVNNALIYIAFGVVLLFTAIAVMSGNIQAALVFGIGGVIIVAVIGGYWCLINCILEENRKQTLLLEKLVNNKITVE